MSAFTECMGYEQAAMNENEVQSPVVSDGLKER